MKEGREASGATANGGVERPRASRVLAGTVERGKNPEDGTDGSLATLVPHGRPKGSPWRRGAPGVDVFVGARTPGEAGPQGSGTARLLLEGAGSENERADGGEVRVL